MAFRDPPMTPSSIFEAERPRLLGLAYRMTGSSTDAEDILQEAFISWSQARGVEDDSAYLTRVVVNRSLDLLGSAKRRREVYVGPWLPEPVFTESPGAEHPVELAETLRLALLLVLDQLSPNERAVFILSEVFGYDHREVSEVLGKSEPACRKSLERARKKVRAGTQTLDASVSRSSAVMSAFVDALRRHDLEAMIAVLREDVILRSDSGGEVPAALRPIRGAPDVARMLLGLSQKLPPEAMLKPVYVNDASGFLVEIADRVDTCVTADVDRTGRICAVHMIRNPKKLGGLATSRSHDAPDGEGAR